MLYCYNTKWLNSDQKMKYNIFKNGQVESTRESSICAVAPGCDTKFWSSVSPGLL
jgi:hypothetical protein